MNKKNNNTLLWKYLSLSTQIIVALGFALFIGIKIDHWLKFTMPLAVWVLPLLNIFFLLLSLLVFFIQRKSLHAANPHQFIRSIMTGMMLKMFLTVAAILIYYFSARHFSRLSVVAAMLMYLFYLSAEIKSLLKLNRKPNA